MANPIVSGLLAAGKTAKAAKPFYSPIDKAIAAITQGKGTGQQMMAELLKTKGVSKELKDRPAIKKVLEQPKVTKQELERVAAENPAPQIEQTIARGVVFDENNPSLPRNNSMVMKELKNGREHGVYDRESGNLLGRGDTEVDAIYDTYGVYPERWGQGSSADYSEYKIPGGSNYREMLIKLPEKSFGRDDPRVMQEALSAYNKKDISTLSDDQWKMLQTRAARRNGEKLKRTFKSEHFEEPNILAHARVQDRVGPNGEKILHVEEIQSDWHQAARDDRKKEIKRLMELEGIDKETANKLVPKEFGYDMPETQRIKGVAQPNNQGGYSVVWEDGTFSGGYSKEGAEAKALEGKSNATRGVVPDAPFKQNWHELVMKRLLDDAARNGYDKVVITQGAEQANRYKLSKQISKIEYEPTEEAGKYEFIAYNKAGKAVLHEDEIPLSRIEELVGEGLTKKIEADMGSKVEGGGYRDFREITGLDLDVGGEGMTGFYDKIIPSYLNDYGKQYGAKVGTYNISDPNIKANYSRYIPTVDDINRIGMQRFGVDRSGMTLDQIAEAENIFKQKISDDLSVNLHSFDITPQMRDEITTKGQSLYQAAPPVAIGAGLSQEEPAPEPAPTYRRGGVVSQDAMSMAVMDKQLRKRNG